MPVLKDYKFNITTVLADGRVITQEEWDANPPVFSYEDNKAVFDDFAFKTNPNYRALKRAERRYQRTEERRKELEKQAAEIKKALADL